MKELKITKILEYGRYIMLDEKNNHKEMRLGFLGIKPQVGDVLALDECLLNKTSSDYAPSYTFEKINAREALKTPTKDIAYILSKTKILLKRMYG